jgi:hypothetical protein
MAATSVSAAPAEASPAVAAEAAPAVAPEAAVAAEAVTPEAVAVKTPVTKSVSPAMVPAANPVSYAVYAIWVIANGSVIANGTVTACQGQTGKRCKQAPPHSLRYGQLHRPTAVSARGHLATRSNTST